MKKLFTLAILMILSLPVVAATNFVVGNDLLKYCESSHQDACRAYVSGVSDASQGKTWDGGEYCLPDKIIIGQAVKVVTKYLNDHPEKLHYSASSLVHDAFLEAFPCP